LADKKTKKMKNWIFNVKKRQKDSKILFRKRLVFEDKKQVEVNSLGRLKGYCDSIKGKLQFK